MKLSEKIAELRRQNGMTQEVLAEKCHVSRQSISKWEADIALPETEKLLLLGDLFHVSMDVLLKDELTLSAVKEVHTCGANAVQGRKQEVFEGVLIKESMTDDGLIDLMHVHKVELWRTGGTPRYWTALRFTSDRADFPQQAAKVMKAGTEGNWFVDFKAGNVKYIVFRDKVLTYRIGCQEEKEAVCRICREMGIGENEMNWTE